MLSYTQEGYKVDAAQHLCYEACVAFEYGWNSDSRHWRWTAIGVPRLYHALLSVEHYAHHIYS